ncbi:ribonuclease H-like domain-containing protein [Tanacetum coccineum]
MTSGHIETVPQHTNELLQEQKLALIHTLQELLAKLGFNGACTSNSHMGHHTSNSGIIPSQHSVVYHMGLHGPIHAIFSPITPPGFPTQPTCSPPTSMHGMGQFQQAQHHSGLGPGFLNGTGSFTVGQFPANVAPGQATMLSQVFSATTLQDHTTGAWNMDTGASSHLNSSVTSLNTVFNTCMYPSISVGDGHSIPVTNTGHSILPTPTKSLHLNNILITPHIVKNLIYVRQFVRDNNRTIEFDAFGFSVKDFLTHRVLLRCDSTGDLYPVTAPSPIPHAFLVSQQTWHQRLGHSGREVLRHLVSNNIISCNKEKPPALCHACQLGKHVRLLFASSNIVVTSCFEIIHSDVWTSPIPSLLGFKYYCDHGGEFDNRNFHKLFADNGIQFRFSCPKTSQQNGKSERMVRTINNLIRTLLFQANLPPTFWVEALNVATHLLNFLPSTAINNEIPYTRLFGTNPDYSLLRTFGCLCYPHLDTNHKLEPRATPSIYLGQASNHRGYRCLDLKTNKIIISRHVTFDETVFPYGSTQPALPPTYTFLDDIPDIIPPTIPTNPAVQLPPEPITPIHNTPIQHHPDAAQLPTTPQQLSQAQVQTTEN